MNPSDPELTNAIHFAVGRLEGLAGTTRYATREFHSLARDEVLAIARHLQNALELSQSPTTNK